MTDIEIPYEKDRHGHYRFFEILPGTLSYLLLLMPFILSLINVTLAAVFVLAYMLIYVVRGIGVAIRGIQAYRVLKQHQKYDWSQLLADLDSGNVTEGSDVPRWHKDTLRRLAKRPTLLKPSDMIH